MSREKRNVVNELVRADRVRGRFMAAIGLTPPTDERRRKYLDDAIMKNPAFISRLYTGPRRRQRANRAVRRWQTRKAYRLLGRGVGRGFAHGIRKGMRLAIGIAADVAQQVGESAKGATVAIDGFALSYRRDGDVVGDEEASPFTPVHYNYLITRAAERETDPRIEEGSTAIRVDWIAPTNQIFYGSMPMDVLMGEQPVNPDDDMTAATRYAVDLIGFDEPDKDGE